MRVRIPNDPTLVPSPDVPLWNPAICGVTGPGGLRVPPSYPPNHPPFLLSALVGDSTARSRNPQLRNGLVFWGRSHSSPHGQALGGEHRNGEQTTRVLRIQRDRRSTS